MRHSRACISAIVLLVCEQRTVPVVSLPRRLARLVCCASFNNRSINKVDDLSTASRHQSCADQYGDATKNLQSQRVNANCKGSPLC